MDTALRIRPLSKEERLREKLLSLAHQVAGPTSYLHLSVRGSGDRHDRLYVVIFNRAAARALATRLSTAVKRPLRWQDMYWTLSEEGVDSVLKLEDQVDG